MKSERECVLELLAFQSIPETHSQKHEETAVASSCRHEHVELDCSIELLLLRVRSFYKFEMDFAQSWLNDAINLVSFQALGIPLDSLNTKQTLASEFARFLRRRSRESTVGRLVPT